MNLQTGATSFTQIFEQHPWADLAAQLAAITPADVEQALSRPGSGNPKDFLALVSPVAAPYLEQMAALSQQLTRKRFGKTVQLYAPLYLSNECINSCSYCGFSKEIDLPRIRLNREQVEAEIKVLKAMGVEHVLVVTGDFSETQAREYLTEAISWIQPHFAQVSMEVQPLPESDYRCLSEQGLHGVMCYQETYGPRYAEFHKKGKKKDFFWRLETPERLGQAGVHKMGLGVLLGLDDWRLDSFYVALHASYIQKKYWQTRLSISFPRLRPAKMGFSPDHPVSDRELVQLILAYRIFDENLELALSTRESPHFRNHMIPLAITSISAGSKTDPGGYANPEVALEQFEINDERSPKEMERVLQSSGLELVTRDWEPHFGLSNPTEA